MWDGDKLKRIELPLFDEGGVDAIVAENAARDLFGIMIKASKDGKLSAWASLASAIGIGLPLSSEKIPAYIKVSFSLAASPWTSMWLQGAHKHLIIQQGELLTLGQSLWPQEAHKHEPAAFPITEIKIPRVSAATRVQIADRGVTAPAELQILAFADPTMFVQAQHSPSLGASSCMIMPKPPRPLRPSAA